MQIENEKVMLIVAHPGHLLNVYHWISQSKPFIWILTDGSGRTKKSQKASANQIILKTKSIPGELFCHYSDSEIYQKFLSKECEFFIALAEKIYDFVVKAQITMIVGDAAEGYNPTHDVCRLLIDAVIKKLNQKRKSPIKNYDFLLIGHPSQRAHLPGSIVLELDEKAFAQKLSAAKDYIEIKKEMDLLFNKWGANVFSIETLSKVQDHNLYPQFLLTKPYYETYGLKQVESGYYSEIIQYAYHIVPLAHALADWANYPCHML